MSWLVRILILSLCTFSVWTEETVEKKKDAVTKLPNPLSDDPYGDEDAISSISETLSYGKGNKTKYRLQVDLSVLPPHWKEQGFVLAGLPTSSSPDNAAVGGDVTVELQDQQNNAQAQAQQQAQITRQDLQRQQQYLQRLQSQLQQQPNNQFAPQQQSPQLQQPQLQLPQQQQQQRLPPQQPQFVGPPPQGQGGPPPGSFIHVQKQQQYIQKLQSQLQEAQKPPPNPIQVGQQQTHQVGPSLQQEYLQVISQQRDYHKKLLQFQLVQKEAELYHQYQLKLAELRYHYQQLMQQVTASKPGVGPGGPPPGPEGPGGPGAPDEDTDDDL